MRRLWKESGKESEMSWCYNEDEHKREGREDFERRGRYGYDHERYDDRRDDCARAYNDGFDEARRAEERREEYRAEEERAAHRAHERALDEQWAQEEQYNQYPEQQWPEPTLEEMCSWNGGHAYYGDDELGPRCYCGKYRDYRAIRLI